MCLHFLQLLLGSKEKDKQPATLENSKERHTRRQVCPLSLTLFIFFFLKTGSHLSQGAQTCFVVEDGFFHVLAAWDHSLDTCPIYRFMITLWSPPACDDMGEASVIFAPCKFSSVDLLLFSLPLPKYDSK